MLTFLFWNLHESWDAAELLFLAIVEHSVDVLVLAECRSTGVMLEERLNQFTNSRFTAFRGVINRRILTFLRTPVTSSGIAFESPYFAVWPVQIPGSPEILLAGIHAPSRRHADLASINEEAIIAAEHLRTTERMRGHDRTVVVGDFNLSPFDEGMAKARGFHAVMDRKTARNGAKRIRFRDYPVFYNPMWSRMGDASPGPPGTYYYSRAGHLNYHWYTFDQVLFRPSLAERLATRDVEVLDRIGSVSLLNHAGTPNRRRFSDHLPIVFRLRPDTERQEEGDHG